MGKRNFIENSSRAWKKIETGAKCKDLLSQLACTARVLPQNVPITRRFEVSMTESTIWWLLAGTVIAVELLTGTFYLLMVSSGLVAAALAAHLGASSTVQLVVAALIGGGTVLAWRSYKQQKASVAPASANRDVNLDVGELVQVQTWDPSGTSTVKYRGANWSVTLTPGATPTPGMHMIVEVQGNRLVVRKV
jgi:membrane protein implicated in regulation of membrane protease activity